ncbi:MAG: molybdenum cofactor guanylyltransferase MobA [Lautropia sp.]|nr:molybdenum cofactor guanylyltransferase MobA [Lautropia sp.]
MRHTPTTPDAGTAEAVDITGVILAGGAARRMQSDSTHIDKGLLPLGGHPLIVWLLQRLAPQVSRLLISANRNLPSYRRLGFPVVTDIHPGQPGPLAGIHAALSAADTDWLAVTACDTPFLPSGWVSVLLNEARRQQRPIAYACDSEREHPLVAVIHRSLQPSFEQALTEDNRRVRRLYRRHGAITVRFDDDTAFFNINTPESWQQAQRLISMPCGSASAPPSSSNSPGSPTSTQSSSPDTSSVLHIPPSSILVSTHPSTQPGPPVSLPCPHTPSDTPPESSTSFASARTMASSWPVAPDLNNATLSNATLGLPGFDPNAVSVEQARAVFARWLPTVVGVEPLPLADCLGRTLAEPLTAPFDLPPYDNAAMDGYALRHSDLDAGDEHLLPLAGITLAGDAPAVLPPGHTRRIMTGAPMPVGADTVVPQEEVGLITAASADDTAGKPMVRFGTKVRAGQHVRLRGEDMRTGDVALPAGRRLMPADIGVAASLGLATLSVYRRLRVGVLSTGSELLQAGQNSTVEGRIYDSNRHTLLTMVTMQGYQAVDLGVLPDQPEALQQALHDAGERVDVILSSGGAAGGDADFIQQVAAMQGEAHAWKLRMRPGRPLIVGRIGQAVLFGLPGNPVAALVCYLFVIRDALRQMAGATPQRPLPIRAQAGCAFDKRAGRTEYQRIRLQYNESGVAVATPCGSQSSAMMRTFADADGIAVLPEACGPVTTGDWIDVIPMHGLLV